jgi:hypothetical protein
MTTRITNRDPRREERNQALVERQKEDLATGRARGGTHRGTSPRSGGKKTAREGKRA